MNILMIGFDTGRWGSARLVKSLSSAGFRVAALCTADNPLAKTRYTDRHFVLHDVHSSRQFEASLAKALECWKPALIVPADERVVACLHALVRDAASGRKSRLTPEAFTTIASSLGYIEQFDASLLKSETLGLARRLGVLVPGGRSVATPNEAIDAAEQAGYPVYVKTSFSWAGQGVSFCRNATEVVAAVTAARPERSHLRKEIKRLLHRDWYPTDTTIDVQQSIVGTPAMYCAVAMRGEVAAGFAGITQQTCSTNGPSSIVWIGADAEMERVSAAMIRALGSTGFIGFDFMIDDTTGKTYLLECNPRPIPVCHLGSRIGVDLCSALAAALSGKTPPPTNPIGAETITLFPQEWQRNPDGIAQTGNYIDVPLDDPALLTAMANAFDGTTTASVSGRSSEPVIKHSIRADAAPAWGNRAHV